jgi:hypothetical protein
MTTTRDRLRREIEATRLSFHQLLDSIPDEAFPLPSDNSAWTVGQVLYHMSLAPRFMVLDVQMIGGRRWVYRLVPRLFTKRLFDWLNARLTRLGAHTPSRSFLSAEYERANAAIVRVLESLSDEDLSRHLPYPDWDPLLTGEVSMEYLFGYIKRHFDSHAAQIRRLSQTQKGISRDDKTLD